MSTPDTAWLRTLSDDTLKRVIGYYNFWLAANTTADEDFRGVIEDNLAAALSEKAARDYYPR